MGAYIKRAEYKRMMEIVDQHRQGFNVKNDIAELIKDMDGKKAKKVRDIINLLIWLDKKEVQNNNGV